MVNYIFFVEFGTLLILMPSESPNSPVRKGRPSEGFSELGDSEITDDHNLSGFNKFNVTYFQCRQYQTQTNHSMRTKYPERVLLVLPQPYI